MARKACGCIFQMGLAMPTEAGLTLGDAAIVGKPTTPPLLLLWLPDAVPPLLMAASSVVWAALVVGRLPGRPLSSSALASLPERGRLRSSQ